MVGIVWVNPQLVMIVVDGGCSIGTEGPAAVAGYVQVHSKNVNPLIVVWIDTNLAEIKWAGTQIIHFDPCLPTIFRSKYAPGLDQAPSLGGLAPFRLSGQHGFVGLNDCHQNAGVLAIHRQ